MANICVVCEKRPRKVYNVSNANNKTVRWVYPNLNKLRFSFKGQTSVKRGAVCNKCVKAEKVVKVV